MTMQERYLDVKDFWLKQTPVRQKELLRVPIRLLLQGVDHQAAALTWQSASLAVVALLRALHMESLTPSARLDFVNVSLALIEFHTAWCYPVPDLTFCAEAL